MERAKQEMPDATAAKTDTPGAVRIGTDGAVFKKLNGMKYGMIACAILAVAGVGFGVYEMLNKPEGKPTQSNSSTEAEAELSDIKQKYSVLQNYVKELEAAGTEVSEEVKDATASVGASFRNAVITSSSDAFLTQMFMSDDFYTDSRFISIDVSNGEIKGCTIYNSNGSSLGHGGSDKVSDCRITGVSGKISMVSKMGNTQMSWPYIGFLLEDGSVEYVSAFDLTDNFSAAVKGKVNFEAGKRVTNIVSDVASSRPESPGGHRTTIFYHDDGSFSVFEESMVVE